MEELFWKTLSHLEGQLPEFGLSYKGIPRRFKAAIHAVDSSTISLIANCMDWAASSVGELYQARWGIEVFFKQIKQTLKVCDFLGHSKQAIRWQLWSALLAYVFLRFQSQMSEWGHSFVRLFAMIRGVIWEGIDLAASLKSYGTAGGEFRYRASAEAAYLPGLAPVEYGTAGGANR